MKVRFNRVELQEWAAAHAVNLPPELYVAGDANPPTLSAAVERRSRYILDLDIIDWWTSGCIYPCEMAYLLGLFDTLGIKSVIESGPFGSA